MTTRRLLLCVAAATALSATGPARAQSPGALRIDPLLGRWAVSPVRDGSAATDPATLAKAGATGLSLQLSGELAGALGGAVVLQPGPEGRFSGVARSGVEATLTPIDARHLGLVLRGQGLHFSLFLVRP